MTAAPTPPPPVRLRITGRQAAALLGALAGVNALVLAAWYGLRALEVSGRLSLVASQLNPGRENTVAAWYSALLLLLVAGSAALCFEIERRRATGEARLLGSAWLVIALLFAGLSLDEAGALHETLGAVPGLDPFGGTLMGWLGVFAIPIAAVGLFLAWFAVRLLRRAPVAAGLLGGGLALFLSVPLQERLEGLLRSSVDGGAAWQRPAVHTVLEEGAELYGALAFAAAGLVYALGTARGAGRGLERVVALDFEPGYAGALAAVLRLTALLGVGLAAVAAALWVVAPGAGYRGNPDGWFSGVAALLGAAGSLGLSRGPGRRAPRTMGVLLVLSLYSVAVSFEQGSGHAFTEQIWNGNLERVVAARAALGGAALLLAAVLLRHPVGRAARAATGTWGLLLAAATLAGEPAGPPLALAAYGALLVALAAAWHRCTAAEPSIGRPQPAFQRGSPVTPLPPP